MRRKRVRKIDVGPGKPVWSFGVMTGTSMDGIDVALLKTDGETVGTFGPTFSHEIPAKKVAIIQDCIERVKTIPTWRLKQRNSWPEWLYEADFAMSEITFDYIEMMRFSQLEYAEKPLQPAWEEIRQDWSQTCSGVHGQTVTHRPEEGFTLQIGQRDWSQGVRRPFCHQSSYFSKRTTDVTGFREDDLRSGGEGAPLAPFYHFALAKHIAADAPLAFLNIGGVANVTWVDPAKALPEEPGALLAFDTGPGNALVNDWMQRHTGEAMDRDGVAAAEGRVHRDRLGSNAARAYLERVPPKSLDRNDFAAMLAAMEGLSVAGWRRDPHRLHRGLFGGEPQAHAQPSYPLADLWGRAEEPDHDADAG